jgi:hypothetical protein
MSMATKMHEFPLADLGIFGIKSTDQMVRGAVTLSNLLKGCFLGAGATY